MKKNELIKRFGLFILGLFIMSIGIAMTKFAELGVTPISSIPNIFSIKTTKISLGTFLIIWNILLIVGQILILRSDFKLYQLIQVPISFLFGYFTDLALKFLSNFTLDSYIESLITLVLGILVLSFGVSLTVVADVILNSGEAFVKAISDKRDLNFGRVKVGFDTFCVIIAVVLSLVFFGSIEGTREGTILSALLTGFIVNIMLKFIKDPILSILNIKK